MKLTKGKIPSQAMCNKEELDEIQPGLACLRKLESILIAQRIVFEKLVIMGKGQQPKVKGAICNVPVDCSSVCKSLPKPPES